MGPPSRRYWRAYRPTKRRQEAAPDADLLRPPDACAASTVVTLSLKAARNPSKSSPVTSNGTSVTPDLKAPRMWTWALLRTLRVNVHPVCTSVRFTVRANSPFSVGPQFRIPWPGDPRVNIQNDKGKAKAYQVRQLVKAIDKKEARRWIP